jgi:hypothetical protein
MRNVRAVRPSAKTGTPTVKTNGKGFGAGTAKSTLGSIASGKAPRQVVNPIKTDRGAFGIKS